MEYGFDAVIDMDDGFEFKIYLCVLRKSCSSDVMQLLKKWGEPKGLCAGISI